MKVFLGGTCNESRWRDCLKLQLRMDYFDPVVPDWTPECQKEELLQRFDCDFCLYVITPKMKGVYSIAEAVDDSNKRPEKIVFCVLEQELDTVDPLRFDEGQLRSLHAVGAMISKNGGKYFKSLPDVVNYLNEKDKEERNQND